ncbi:MAG: group II intron maturase-specific domain-containing protein [Gammaproteobacteria bacterium]|jgi:Group II intron, maturase-specific domain/META domain
MAGVLQAAHKEWTLTMLNGKEIIAETPPAMKFEHDKFSVFGGINRLSGSYALLDNTVTMGPSISLDERVRRLKNYLRGWRGYFGFCETAKVLRDLDSWIRLRCVQWKQ